MKVEKASDTDLREILNLQKLAFQIQAKIYNDYTIPPLIQTFDEIKNDFSEYIFLKAVIGNKIVGSVRAYKEDNTCNIGRLIVHPDFHNQGIGTKLMEKIESSFVDVNRFELFTGHKSKKNLYLYEKLRYKVFKREKIDENLTLVFLEKNI